MVIQGIKYEVGIWELSNWEHEMVDMGGSLDLNIPSLLGDVKINFFWERNGR